MMTTKEGKKKVCWQCAKEIKNKRYYTSLTYGYLIHKKCMRKHLKRKVDYEYDDKSK